MKKTFTLPLIIIFSLVIVSCQKEIDGSVVTTSAGDITGTWKFISLSAKTNSINEIASGANVEKSVTSSEYTTENNTGTVTINNTELITNNLSYEVNTVAKGSFYQNGVLADTFSIPVQAATPAFNSTAPYTRVNADSLYFQSGGAFSGGLTQGSQPGGARIKLEQDKLYFYHSAYQQTSNTVQGEILTSTIQANVTVTLQRQ